MATKEVELEESELHLRDIEKSDKFDSNPKKRREMEQFIKKLRDEGIKTGFKKFGLKGAVGGP